MESLQFTLVFTVLHFSQKKQKKEKKCDIVITYTKETRGAEFSSVILVEGDPLTWVSASALFVHVL